MSAAAPSVYAEHICGTGVSASVGSHIVFISVLRYNNGKIYASEKIWDYDAYDYSHYAKDGVKRIAYKTVFH